MSTKNNNQQMLEGPLLKNIIAYTVPIILTSILQLLFNAADLVVVGRFCGSISVAAVGATGSITSLIVNLFIGLSVGAGVTAAHGIGSREDDVVHKTVHTAVPMALVSGAVLTVVGVAILGVIFASDPTSSIFRVVSFAWAGFGATFGPAMLCALFWKRTTWQGILAGMLTGGVMVFVWKFLVKPMGGVWGIYELLPAFLMGLAVIILVSLSTKKPEKSLIDPFDAVKAIR